MRDFSVVMACRNRADQMRVSLPTYIAPHFVFVDDGSTDESWETAVRLLPGDRTLMSKTGHDGRYRPNPGVAWNKAVMLSKTERIVMACPECAVAPDTLGLLIDALEPDVITLATTWQVKRWGKNGLPEFDRCRGLNRDITDDGWKKHRGIGTSGERIQWCGNERPVPFIFCGALHRQLWLDFGGYDDVEKRGADGRFAQKAIKAGVTFRIVGPAVAFHLEHART